MTSGLKAEGNSTGLDQGKITPAALFGQSLLGGNIETFPTCPAFRFLLWHVGLSSRPSLLLEM